MFRTYQPKKRQRSKEHGFRKNGHPQRPQGSGPSSCQGSCPSDPLRSRKVHRTYR